MFLRLAERVKRGVQVRLHRHVLDRTYDRANEIETNGLVLPDALALRGDNAMHASEYEPTPTIVFRRMINSLPSDLHGFVFIDLGSGKGRTLLLAAHHPFRRIECVELSLEMHEIALKNIAATCLPSANITAHNMDATEYEIPLEPFVLYMFNPFQEAVLARVLGNVEQSLRRLPREAYILYVNAKHKDLLDSAEFLEAMPRFPWVRALDRLISPWPLAFYRTFSARSF